MGSVIALGESHELDGFALVGADVVHVDDPTLVRTAWAELDDDVGLVVLTGAAAEALGDLLDERPEVLKAVMP